MPLQSNIPDFLFENANRSFPFEDSVEFPTKLSYSSVLDLKGFSRSPVAGKVKLVGVSRWGNAESAPTIPSEVSTLIQQGYIQLYFQVPSEPSDIYIQLAIPISNTTWPYKASTEVLSLGGTKYITLSGIVGQSILTDFPSRTYRSFDSTYLEQSTIMECYKKSLDQLRILHSNGSSEYVTGKLVFANGTNSSVSQSGNSIRVTAKVGDGLGRARSDSEDISEKCDGIIQINGIPPTTGGKFTIEGGMGISVVDEPENNKIIISIQKGSRLLDCEEAP